MSVSGVSNLAFGGLQSVSAEATPQEGRQNKKSKWDKVDGDRRTALTCGQSTQAAAAAHATVLSTANARSGYTTSMQQRRRERKALENHEKEGRSDDLNLWSKRRQ